MVARGIAKQILGTIVAVLAGWLAALLYVELSGVVQLLQQPHYIVPEALFVGPITAGVFMAYFIIPVWLFVLIPLYLFVPPSSPLWRWPICTACGTLAGITIIAFTLRLVIFHPALPRFFPRLGTFTSWLPLSAGSAVSLPRVRGIDSNNHLTKRCSEPRPAPMRSFRVISSSSLQPRALSGAVADLVSR